MPDTPVETGDDSDDMVDLLVEFGHELRAAGVVVGSGDVVAYCTAAAALNPADIVDHYWAGRTTMVTRRDHIPVYDRVFRQFFLDDFQCIALVEGGARVIPFAGQ